MLHILPVMCSGGASPGAEPSITAVRQFDDAGPSCAPAVNWTRRVEWDMSFFNDVGYEIEIYDVPRATVVVSDLLTSAGFYIADTGVTGDPLGTGSFHDSQYTVRLVRKSDLTVVDSMTTSLVSIETGPAC